MSRENRWPWKLILCSALGGLGLCILLHNPPADRPPDAVLPVEAVEVEVRSQADIDREVLDAGIIAGLREANGQLTDELGQAVKVIESLTVEGQGAPAEAPAAELIQEVAADPERDISNLVYRPRAKLFKFEGMAHGEYTFGWAGKIYCDVAEAADAPQWSVLVWEPLTLENTVAAVTEQPKPPRRPHRWYATGRYAVLTDSTSFYDEISFSPDKLGGSVGRIWFPRKRFPIRTGVWGSASAAGVELGVDW